MNLMPSRSVPSRLIQEGSVMLSCISMLLSVKLKRVHLKALDWIPSPNSMKMSSTYLSMKKNLAGTKRLEVLNLTVTLPYKSIVSI